MELVLNEKNGSRVAVVRGDGPLVTDLQSALDLMADARYSLESGKLLLRREQLSPEFFELRTGLAGEILQKYTTYGLYVAIVGDFSGEKSKSLRDFIRESNRTGRIFFLPDEASALEALHGAD